MKQTKTQRGITLIALIITTIITENILVFRIALSGTMIGLMVAYLVKLSFTLFAYDATLNNSVCNNV